MLVKNNIAQPGEIKSVALDTNQVEVRLRSGKVMHYERKDLIVCSSDPERTASEKEMKGNE